MSKLVLSDFLNLLTTIILAENNKYVHGAHFSDIVFWTMEPEILSVSLLSGVLLREDTRRVVDS